MADEESQATRGPTDDATAPVRETEQDMETDFGKYGPLRVREHAVWTMQCSAYFPKAHAELSRRVKSNVLPHLSR